MKTKEQIRKSITGSIRMERRSRGYTQKSIGEAMADEGGPAVAASTINAWEGDGGSIGLDDAWRMADLFGISLDQLAGRA